MSHLIACRQGDYMTLLIVLPTLFFTLPQSQPTTTTTSQSPSRFSCVKSAQESSLPFFSRCLRVTRLSTGEGPDRLPRRSSLCNVRSKRQFSLLFSLFLRVVGPSVQPNLFRFSAHLSSIFDYTHSQPRSTCSSALSLRRIARASRLGRARDRFASIRS